MSKRFLKTIGLVALLMFVSHVTPQPTNAMRRADEHDYRTTTSDSGLKKAISRKIAALRHISINDVYYHDSEGEKWMQHFLICDRNPLHSAINVGPPESMTTSAVVTSVKCQQCATDKLNAPTRVQQCTAVRSAKYDDFNQIKELKNTIENYVGQGEFASLPLEWMDKNNGNISIPFLRNFFGKNRNHWGELLTAGEDQTEIERATWFVCKSHPHTHPVELEIYTDEEPLQKPIGCMACLNKIVDDAEYVPTLIYKKN